MQEPELIRPVPMDKSLQGDPFEQVIKLLDSLSAYQLFRLQGRIDIEMEEPERLKVSTMAAAPGSEIEYYCRTTNRCVKAIVSKLNRTTVDVTNVDDGKRWRIGLAAVNTGGVENSARSGSTSQLLTRHDLSVGQIVGFQDREFQDRYGKIIRLNPKTVSLECESGTKWRVGYSLLFAVLDVNSSNTNTDQSDDGPKQQLLLE